LDINGLGKARLAAKIANDKKGENIIILNIGKVSNITDYFVIVSAESSKRVETIAEAIAEEFKKNKLSIVHFEGFNDCLWVLLDASDVILHIFRSDMREFYALERLWSSAEQVKL